jgi:tetratricopeptide (TPR) repeat protein
MRKTMILALGIGLACQSGCKQKDEQQFVDQRSMCFVVTPDYQALVQASTRSTAPLFDNMGAHRHEITTNSEQAQLYFDQGINLLYGFNHGEAIRSFCEAARLDSNAAMAYWGAALALGPNINKEMDSTAVPDAYKAVLKAMNLRAKTSEKEQAYIAALARRYAPEYAKDRSPLDLAYANAMREVVRQHPDDLDAATLFAEALMDLIPWDYYTEDGQPKRETIELIATLESVLERHPNHPGANHYYIHAVEASSTPERAELAADRLGNLVPDAGHLVHMPSHIYLRIGRYNDASEANVRAADADESYITQCNAQGFYPALYYPHNIHFLWFTSSIEGRSQTSIDAANRLAKNVYREQIKDFPPLESFLPIPLFALARFGKWEEILAAPQPPAEFAYETAMWHYTRGLAFAGKGEAGNAEHELAVLDSLSQSEAIQSLEQPFYFGATLVGIAKQILSAKVVGLQGELEGMITQLRDAVARQDELPYMEPPYWYYPVRQTLGAALLQAEKPSEAEEVFRMDLEKTPHNGWSLYGLYQSLEAQGSSAEAQSIRQQYIDAWNNADVELDLAML